MTDAIQVLVAGSGKSERQSAVSDLKTDPILTDNVSFSDVLVAEAPNARMQQTAFAVPEMQTDVPNPAGGDVDGTTDSPDVAAATQSAGGEPDRLEKPTSETLTLHKGREPAVQRGAEQGQAPGKKPHDFPSGRDPMVPGVERPVARRADGDALPPPNQPDSAKASLTQAALAKGPAIGLATSAVLRPMKAEAMSAVMSALPAVNNPASIVSVRLNPAALAAALPSKVTDATALRRALDDVPRRVPNAQVSGADGPKAQHPTTMPNTASLPVFTEKDVPISLKDTRADEALLHVMRAGPNAEASPTAKLMAPVASQPQTEVARQIGGQLALAVTQQKQGVTEVALNPQELGRVRMTLMAQDNTMVLSVSAERPETQDLMRRHIEQLGQEFRNLGFQDVKFSFQDRPSTSHRPTDDTDGFAPETNEIDDAQSQTSPAPVAAADAGLDLRL